uniref:Glyco_hydro_92 n=1 Tax=uncultured Vibrio sp. TaxID=114054 RepID=A0A060C2L2_9VIBR|nr:Glyco_hydro_92 [uncultured Vibrio sp.]
MARNVSKDNMYIQNARLNGALFNKSYITHDELMKGGTLEFVMGKKPNKKWAISSDACPPSLSE